MIILRDEIRSLMKTCIITFLILIGASLCAAVYLETRAPMELTYIRTPEYVVAGDVMTITEVGMQRASCMPTGVARYLVLPGNQPPFSLITDANPPNAVLALKAAEAQRTTAVINTSVPQLVAKQPDIQQASKIQHDTTAQKVSITLRVPVPLNSPTGKLQYGEQYDFAPCGILRGLLPIHTVTGAGSWMTVLPPGSKIPTSKE